MFLTILGVLWVVFVGIQLIYWGIVFNRFAQYKNTTNLNDTTISYPAVSVVICARNEADNLQKNLKTILQQDYPVWELIVVNDDSEDETGSILQAYQQEYPSLRIITVKNKKKGGKKAALTKGIQAAQYDWLLLTDADCQPQTDQWIKTMQHQVWQHPQAQKIQIVLGYGPYFSKSTLLNSWVQYETIYVAIQYFSFALWKVPYMGVGRNLMYQKELFWANKGFEAHQEILSGDDDLFINAVANSENTVICVEPAGFMYSTAPATWKGLYRQKTRHYSSSSSYQWYFQVLLGLLALSHFGFYAGIGVFFYMNIWNKFVLCVIIIRLLLLYKVWLKSTQKLHEIKILPYLWAMDMLLPLYYIVFAISTLNYPNKKWK